jgi:lysozyme
MSVYGVDISHWDGKIDWAIVKPKIGFAILKASEGTGWVDDTFEFNRAGCQSNSIPHGAYHFFRSNQAPKAQAEHFWNIVSNANLKFLALDVETNDGSWNGLSIADTVKICLDRLQELSGNIPWIYTGPYFWRDVVKSPAWSVNYWLWIANYGVQDPMIPPPWTTYGIWQFSSKGQIAGIPANVDENWFDGDLQEMNDCFANGNEVPEKMRVKVNVANLTIRSAPIVTPSTVLGYTTLGKVWTVECIVQDTSGRDWAKVGAEVYIAKWLCQEV